MNELPSKPLPVPNANTQPFWDGCALGELRIQHCDACGRSQFPPRDFCVSCNAASLRWISASGRGSIASHTRVERPPSPAFRQEIPYVLALIDLEEGPRLMMRLEGDASTTYIGAAVGVRFAPPKGPHNISLPYAVQRLCQPPCD